MRTHPEAISRLAKKNQAIEKKCLTSFLRSGIGLKNSNSIVLFVHNSTGKEVKILGGGAVVNFVSGLNHHETGFTSSKINKRLRRRKRDEKTYCLSIIWVFDYGF